MNRLIDKILLMIISVFAMYQTVHGKAFLVLIYTSVAFSSINYYLLTRERTDFKMAPEGVKEYAALFIQIVFAVALFFYPSALIIAPLLAYDFAHLRNYIAFGVLLIAFSASAGALSLPLIIFLILMTGVAIIMNIRTERELVLSSNFKKLRDDSSEKNALLRKQNQELLSIRDSEVYNAQLAERNRIAREIHDNVGHTLSRAILQMGALLAIHKEEPVHSELEDVRQTLDSAMNNIRSSVHDLHDESIDVAAAINQLAEPLKSKFKVNLDIDIGGDMPRPVKYSCIGITKECISNIIKHSSNPDVDIRLSEHPSMYQLVIHDYDVEGSATYTKDADKNKSSSDIGMGLENIRTRTEAVNGSLNISTENGFRVFVSIPRK